MSRAKLNATPPKSRLLPVTTTSFRQSASREGARAVVGALADNASLFERVALVIPPGGHALGRYASWLESLPATGRVDLSTNVVVVGHRGDQGHPARVATAWAEKLGAHLELLSSRAVYTDPDQVAKLLAEFLN